MNVVNGEIPTPTPAASLRPAPSAAPGADTIGTSRQTGSSAWRPKHRAGHSQNGVSPPYGFAVNTKVDWFGSERVRLGFLATPSVLVYGTSGLGWAHVMFSDTSFGTDVGSFNQYRVRWAGSGGLEWAFGPQWSANLECLYSDLGTYQGTFGITQKTSSPTLNTVKVSLSHHGNILATVLGRL